MALRHIVAAAQDGDLQQRVAACVVAEAGFEGDPLAWAVAHRWKVAAAPGIGDKFDSAEQTGIGRPGWHPGVVSDADILAIVQAIRTAEAPPA